jgi:hypothetical protein
LIPILAKVEFDIDRRKAAWYDPWLRSRKVNHTKRTESRKGSKSPEKEEPREHVPIEFLTGKKNKSNPFGLLPSEPVEAEDKDAEPVLLQEGYSQLSGSSDEIGSDSDSDTEDFGEEATARVSSLAGGKDPLGDVFGTDADTWADIHATNSSPSSFDNPNVVNLALTAEALEALPSPRDLEDDVQSAKEEDEVLDMLDMMSKPSLAISIPSPPNSKRSSSPIATIGRKVPPPLVLKPKDKSGTTLVLPLAIPKTADSMNGTHLAYLGDETDEVPDEGLEEDGDYEGYTHGRSPTESDKRVGAIFDDLDLGLEPSEEVSCAFPSAVVRLILTLRIDLV